MGRGKKKSEKETNEGKVVFDKQTIRDEMSASCKDTCTTFIYRITIARHRSEMKGKENKRNDGMERKEKEISLLKFVNCDNKKQLNRQNRHIR